jgi:hypothetical protein
MAMRRVFLKVESASSRFDGQRRATLTIEQGSGGDGLVTVTPYRSRHGYTTTLEDAAACIMSRAARLDAQQAGVVVPAARRR